MKMPDGYQIEYDAMYTVCYWVNCEGESGDTHHWDNSFTYIIDCIEDAISHNEARQSASES